MTGGSRWEFDDLTTGTESELVLPSTSGSDEYSELDCWRGTACSMVVGEQSQQASRVHKTVGATEFQHQQPSRESELQLYLRIQLKGSWLCKGVTVNDPWI